MPSAPIACGSLEDDAALRPGRDGEQGVELGFDLLICIVQRLKEDWVSRQKVAAQAGLFVDHQFDEPVGVENDDIGAIDCARTLLNALQAVAEDESQNSE